MTTTRIGWRAASLGIVPPLGERQRDLRNTYYMRDKDELDVAAGISRETMILASE
jgi:hypothetical protein